MANEAINRIFGQLTGQKPVTTPIKPAGLTPVSFGASQPLTEKMSFPEKNPFGQISPNVTNDTQARKLPRLYA